MAAKITEQQRVDEAIRRKNYAVSADLALEAEVWKLLNTDIFSVATWEEAHAAIIALVKSHRVAPTGTED